MGAGNHGWFSLFILSMYTLLVSTTTVLLYNINSYENGSEPRGHANGFLVPMLLPHWLYKKEVVWPVTYTCCGVCILFFMPLT